MCAKEVAVSGSIKDVKDFYFIQDRKCKIHLSNKLRRCFTVCIMFWYEEIKIGVLKSFHNVLKKKKGICIGFIIGGRYIQKVKIG